MRNLVLAMALGLGGQGVATAQGSKRCEEVRERIGNGVMTQVELEAIDLFDATQRRSHILAFELIPSANGECRVHGPDLSIFPMAKNVQIKTARTTYSGIWDTEYPHVLVNDSQIALAGGKLAAYHAVFASLMSELGYDSFESASGTPFPALGDSWFGWLPSNDAVSSLVGVVGTNGRLYQVMVKRIGLGPLR